MSGLPLTLLSVGDIMLRDAPADRFFDPTRTILRDADVVVGHIERLLTLRGHHAVAEPGTRYDPIDPALLEALGRAGFDVATLAHNHTYDGGPAAISDSIEVLRAQGIQTTGAGMNIEEARAPAIVERDGVRFGFLSYNCVGPRAMWASSTKAGCAYVNVLSHYEMDIANPGGMPQAYTFLETESLEAMQDDIGRLRALVDVVSVSMHKGLVHAPGGPVGAYERQLAKAAVDAGADVVFGHHAHALRGIEVYKGKPIFHGLGNFVAISGQRRATPEGLRWQQRRRALYGGASFEPDPNYPDYPFLPEAKNAMIAFCHATRDGVVGAGFIPCWVRPDCTPEPLGRDARGEGVFAYVNEITRNAGLNATYRWDGDRVVVANLADAARAVSASGRADVPAGGTR